MGCRELFRNFFSLLNGVIIIVGLIIAGISIYFAVENANYDVFGDLYVWATVAPAALGSVMTILACCSCLVKMQEKGCLLYIYGLLLFASGGAIILAGASQFLGIGYQLEISNAISQKDLSEGFMDAVFKLQSYDLGMYNICCDKNTTVLYKQCSASSLPDCFHDPEYFDQGMDQSQEFCDLLNDKEELGFCADNNDLNAFNKALHVYLDTSFYIASVILMVCGGIMLSTSCCAVQAGIRNRTDPD